MTPAGPAPMTSTSSPLAGDEAIEWMIETVALVVIPRIG